MRFKPDLERRLIEDGFKNSVEALWALEAVIPKTDTGSPQRTNLVTLAVNLMSLRLGLLSLDPTLNLVEITVGGTLRDTINQMMDHNHPDEAESPSS